ncbi:alpha/beta fold hydrolase [Saccharothrix obliqua]|uniref:alpha/beta fold hydrolase n=1 Tax=Saccharothrix obliqua TaxID=2861747 RepID=UPI001C607002|nr:alpha/beta hydrolase [Saccharothrix obliqua]MBW4717135.1 alpha/beta hydrolase [Saccharothrix obliqua]
MAAVHATVLPGPADAPPAVFVHGVLSWGSDDLYGFGNQRPLAVERTLLLVDRRGHGASPDLAGPHTTDYAVDAEDVVHLLGSGAHLVGHSYGAVGAMLAAARRPDLVRSLCLIQPGALRAAEAHPVVAEALRRNRSATVALPPDLTPHDYLRLTAEAVGMTPAEPTSERLRAARAAMGERPCWDAPTPLEPLADAPWPTLVVRGDWSGAPAEYRRLAGAPLMAAAEVIAERVGAELLTVPGYYPHVQHPGPVNAALSDLWRAADG